MPVPGSPQTKTAEPEIRLEASVSSKTLMCTEHTVIKRCLLDSDSVTRLHQNYTGPAGPLLHRGVDKTPSSGIVTFPEFTLSVSIVGSLKINQRQIIATGLDSDSDDQRQPESQFKFTVVSAEHH